MQTIKGISHTVPIAAFVRSPNTLLAPKSMIFTCMFESSIILALFRSQCCKTKNPKKIKKYQQSQKKKKNVLTKVTTKKLTMRCMEWKKCMPCAIWTAKESRIGLSCITWNEWGRQCECASESEEIEKEKRRRNRSKRQKRWHTMKSLYFCCPASLLNFHSGSTRGQFGTPRDFVCTLPSTSTSFYVSACYTIQTRITY